MSITEVVQRHARSIDGLLKFGGLGAYLFTQALSPEARGELFKALQRNTQEVQR